MDKLGTTETRKIFESRPKESAAWLVSFDCIAALYNATRSYQPIEYPSEIAAKSLISSVGNGDYRTTGRLLTAPETHSVGMRTLVRNLGAISVRGRVDPSVVAAVSYREDKSLQREISGDLTMFDIYQGARSFPEHFVSLARKKFKESNRGSLADTLYSIRSDTLFWIDK